MLFIVILISYMTDNYTKVLKKYFGFDSFRGRQLEIIKAVLEDKRDVCVIMFTGAGKSLCYQFPAVYTNKVALVISPLISLSNDQAMKMEQLNIPVCCLNSTVKFKNNVKENILQNKFRLVYVTPEFIVKEEAFIKELRDNDLLISISLDEAHTISTWSHDFRTAYSELGCIKKWIPEIPVMALTATATVNVQKDIINIMKLVSPLIIKTTFDRPNLIINLKHKSANIERDLLTVVIKNEPTIIYCQKRTTTEKITKILNKNNIICEFYHAGMGTSDRESVHKKFSSNEISCVAATVAFGMGIDITIRKVIHYGTPQNMESYYQEIGRAGRDGKESYCILFHSPTDAQINNYFITQITNIPYRMHRIQLALVMKNYVFSSECRRKYILGYFNEKYDKENCKSCDNCLKIGDVQMHDFAKEAYLLLKVLNLTGNKYGACMLVDILRGSDAKKIPPVYKKSDVHGKGKTYSDKWWKIFISLMINSKYISEVAISGSRAFSLMVSPLGNEWLNKYIMDNTTKLLFPVPQEMPELLVNKKNTMESTAELLALGKTIDEIAKELKLTNQTIENHICELYEQDYLEDLEIFGFNDKIYNLIINKINENCNTLKDIKAVLPKYISYLCIRLAIIKKKKEDETKS